METYYRTNLVNILCYNAGYFDMNRLAAMRAEVTSLKIFAKV